MDNEDVAFVLHGAKVRKFCRAGRGRPHIIFLRLSVRPSGNFAHRPCPSAVLPLQEDGRVARWKDNEVAIIGVDGRLFDDVIFRGDGFFDRHITEEALAFSVVVTGLAACLDPAVLNQCDSHARA